MISSKAGWVSPDYLKHLSLKCVCGRQLYEITLVIANREAIKISSSLFTEYRYMIKETWILITKLHIYIYVCIYLLLARRKWVSVCEKERESQKIYRRDHAYVTLWTKSRENVNYYFYGERYTIKIFENIFTKCSNI